METIIKFQNVSKEFKVLNRHEGIKGGILDLFSHDYKTVNAVKNVSFEINKGEMIGYLGPNGAGKSTTIKMMTGVLEPTSGEIVVNGKTPYKNRSKNAEDIGVVFGQRSQLWWSLPLIESFNLLRDIYQIPSNSYEAQLSLYESLIDIKPLYKKLVREMSLGQRTLCDILAAFLHNPSVIFLDEPTIGLDISMKSKVRTLINEMHLRLNTTVILTTHDIGDIDALCKRIIIIDKGSVLYDDTAINLSSHFRAYRTLRVRFEQFECVKDINNEIVNNFINVQTNINEQWLTIFTCEEEYPVMNILKFIQNRVAICDIKIEEITTEDIIKKIYEDGI